MRSIAEIPESCGRSTPTIEESVSVQPTGSSSPRQPDETRLTPRRIYIQVPVEERTTDYQLSTDHSGHMLAGDVTLLRGLEHLEREAWEMRYPGTELNSDQLLREIKDEVDEDSDIHSRIFRLLLVRAHDLRETIAEQLAFASEASLVSSAHESSPVDYDGVGIEADKRLSHTCVRDACLAAEPTTETSSMSDHDITLRQRSPPIQ